MIYEETEENHFQNSNSDSQETEENRFQFPEGRGKELPVGK